MFRNSWRLSKTSHWLSKVVLLGGIGSWSSRRAFVPDGEHGKCFAAGTNKISAKGSDDMLSSRHMEECHQQKGKLIGASFVLRWLGQGYWAVLGSKVDWSCLAFGPVYNTFVSSTISSPFSFGMVVRSIWFGMSCG